MDGRSTPLPEARGSWPGFDGPDTWQREQLEAKAHMKKRGLKSPNRADALAISFAFPVSKLSGRKASPAFCVTEYDRFPGAERLAGGRAGCRDWDMIHWRRGGRTGFKTWEYGDAGTKPRHGTRKESGTKSVDGNWNLCFK